MGVGLSGYAWFWASPARLSPLLAMPGLGLVLPDFRMGFGLLAFGLGLSDWLAGAARRWPSRLAGLYGLQFAPLGFWAPPVLGLPAVWLWLAGIVRLRTDWPGFRGGPQGEALLSRHKPSISPRRRQCQRLDMQTRLFGIDIEPRPLESSSNLAPWDAVRLLMVSVGEVGLRWWQCGGGLCPPADRLKPQGLQPSALVETSRDALDVDRY